MKRAFKNEQQELLQKLEHGMAEYGFEFTPKDSHFEKHITSGRLAFRPGFVHHDSDFDVIASVSVRLESLERLIYEEDEGRFLLSYSMGAELGNISEGKQKRWTVKAQADVETVSKSMLSAFSSIGLPYLERYSIMEDALEALSRDDKTGWLHSPVHEMRAKRALALAFLLHKKDSFRRLADEKSAFLASRNDPKLGEFLSFIQKLENRL